MSDVALWIRHPPVRAANSRVYLGIVVSATQHKDGWLMLLPSEEITPCSKYHHYSGAGNTIQICHMVTTKQI